MGLKKRNPIARWAEEGLTNLVYPHPTMMGRWLESTTKAQNDGYILYVGRLGDTTDFASLPTRVQTVAIAQSIGAVPKYPEAGELRAV